MAQFWPAELKGQFVGELLGKVPLTPKENNKQTKLILSVDCPSPLHWILSVACDAYNCSLLGP